MRKYQLQKRNTRKMNVNRKEHKLLSLQISWSKFEKKVTLYNLCRYQLRINPKSTENIFLLSPSQIFYQIKLKLNEVVFNVLHNCHSLTMNLFNSLEYLIVYLTTGILYQIYQILTITSKKSLKYVI